MKTKDLKLEMWDKVIDDCQKVLDIENNNVKALLRRATAYHKRKRFIEAINDINECLKLEPNNNKAQVNYFIIKFLSKKFKNLKFEYIFTGIEKTNRVFF